MNRCMHGLCFAAGEDIKDLTVLSQVPPPAPISDPSILSATPVRFNGWACLRCRSGKWQCTWVGTHVGRVHGVTRKRCFCPQYVAGAARLPIGATGLRPVDAAPRARPLPGGGCATAHIAASTSMHA